MIDFQSAYEAPISLDDPRLIGTAPRRQSLWIVAALFILAPVAIGNLAVVSMPDRWQEWFVTLVTVAIPVAAIWSLVCYVMAIDWGGRPFEYWLKVRLRSLRMPRNLEYSLPSDEYPIGAVEVGTANLRKTDPDVLAGHIKKLHMMLLGLDFPVRIVIRAWPKDEHVERRWFIVTEAESPTVLDTNIGRLVKRLDAAGLAGQPLNGTMAETQRMCFSRRQSDKSLVVRGRHHAVVDGEYVRGMLLKAMPRTIDPNWLAPMLDGDLPVDFSLDLDPIPQAEELDFLEGRINEWETSQVLTFNKSGYRDVTTDERIKDAQRTRLYLRQHKLKVFTGTMGFVVRGSSADEMWDRDKQVVDLLREHVGPMPVVPLDHEHDRAMLLSVPGPNPASYPLQMVSPAIAMSYPFSNSSMDMPGGVECGTSIESRRPNRLNPWLRGNPHIVEIGTTGAGKGYWLKVWLYRLMMMYPTTKVWIIQAEKDEYTSLSDAMPWEVWQHLDPKPRGQVIRIDDVSRLDSTIWLDKTNPLRRLAGAQLTVYDLTHMPPKDHGWAVAALLEAIEQDAALERRETLGHVVIDELGIVLRDPAAALAIETGYRRFRSIPHVNHGGVSRRGMIGLTQLPSDFLGDPKGKKIIGLSDTHLYLKQKPPELRATRSVLGLSDDEVRFLETCNQGDALLVSDTYRVGLHVHATDEEHEFAKT